MTPPIAREPSCKHVWGRVYFARVNQDGPVKIGFTTMRWRGRLNEIRTPVGKPQPLLLIECGPSLELQLHALLEPHHIGREWFEPAPAIRVADEISGGTFDWDALPAGWCVTKSYQTKASIAHWGALPGRIAA